MGEKHPTKGEKGSRGPKEAFEFHQLVFGGTSLDDRPVAVYSFSSSFSVLLPAKIKSIGDLTLTIVRSMAKTTTSLK